MKFDFPAGLHPLRTVRTLVLESRRGLARPPGLAGVWTLGNFKGTTVEKGGGVILGDSVRISGTIGDFHYWEALLFSSLRRMNILRFENYGHCLGETMWVDDFPLIGEAMALSAHLCPKQQLLGPPVTALTLNYPASPPIFPWMMGSGNCFNFKKTAMHFLFSKIFFLGTFPKGRWKARACSTSESSRRRRLRIIKEKEAQLFSQTPLSQTDL